MFYRWHKAHHWIQSDVSSLSLPRFLAHVSRYRSTLPPVNFSTQKYEYHWIEAWSRSHSLDLLLCCIDTFQLHALFDCVARMPIIGVFCDERFFVTVLNYATESGISAGIILLNETNLSQYLPIDKTFLP